MPKSRARRHEVTRIIWSFIKNQLILPHLAFATAKAIKECGVRVKCVASRPGDDWSACTVRRTVRSGLVLSAVAKACVSRRTNLPMTRVKLGDGLRVGGKRVGNAGLGAGSRDLR